MRAHRGVTGDRYEILPKSPAHAGTARQGAGAAGAGIVVVGAACSYVNIYMPDFARTQLRRPPGAAVPGAAVAGVINTLPPAICAAPSERLSRIRARATTSLISMLIVYSCFFRLLAAPTVGTLLVLGQIFLRLRAARAGRHLPAAAGHPGGHARGLIAAQASAGHVRLLPIAAPPG
jgi:hypothetical protein